MSPSTEDLVLQLALSKGLLSQEQIAAARAVVAHNLDLGAAAPQLLDLLIAEGTLGAERLADLVAEAFGARRVRLSAETIVAADVLACVPKALAVRHGMLPLTRDGRTLCVATCEPWATDGVDNLAHVSGLSIELAVASSDEISQAIERCYGRPIPVFDECGSPHAPPDAHSFRGEIPNAADDAEDGGDVLVVRLVRSIILRAVNQRASDIHLEPLENRFRVRFRIDGVLFEVDAPPKRLQLAIISRVKIMANISIAEKRLPQDGRIQIVLGERALDLRVSSVPTAHGESVVMRILDPQGVRTGLAELGLDGETHAELERLIEAPDGMILVTGPTGSGKTTTLYACLNHLNRADRKIITVEDPVEYQLSGINQVPVRPEVGLTFAAALRAILRQAPNVVMIGEIRDLETAEIAIQASLTGHLVFSTLHTNDAPSAVTRLLDLGVKPFLIAASLRGVLAQRLVRKTCEKCRERRQSDRHDIQRLGGTTGEWRAATLARGAGCAECRGTGYRGRTGIFELFHADGEMQQLIHARASAVRLREEARARGMRTIREDGLAKASAGLTTVEEVVSITVGDSS